MKENTENVRENWDDASELVEHGSLERRLERGNKKIGKWGPAVHKETEGHESRMNAEEDW